MTSLSRTPPAQARPAPPARRWAIAGAMTPSVAHRRAGQPGGRSAGGDLGLPGGGL
jgi:hypothetical protein